MVRTSFPEIGVEDMLQSLTAGYGTTRPRLLVRWGRAAFVRYDLQPRRPGLARLDSARSHSIGVRLAVEK
jgi:hypothetical protein